MTTIAFDGKIIAGDTLSSDSWGLKREINDKVIRGKYILIGAAGESAQIRKWRNVVIDMPIKKLLQHGYPDYELGKNDPQIIVIDTNSKTCYRHDGGLFLEVNEHFYAIGSGRDYALAAMHLGKSAINAIKVAAVFDINTGSKVLFIKLG